MSPVETTGYDGDGNIVRTTDANNNTTTSTYDPLGRQISTTDPVSGTSIITYAATEKLAEQDPQGNVTTYQYDPAGRMVQETDPTGGVTQNQYDAVGNTTAVTTTGSSGLVSVDTRQYDVLNRLALETVSGPGLAAPKQTGYWYDEDGNVSEIEQPNGDTTFNTYNLADQQTELDVNSGTVNGPSDADVYEDYTYDAAGNRVTTRDADNRITTVWPDADNRTVQSVDTGSGTTITTTTSYDPDGNGLTTTRTTQPSSGPTQTSIQAAAYNALDWTTNTTDTITQTLATQYGYDAAGQQKTQTIIDGNTPVTTQFDQEGRATSVAEGYGGGTNYSTTYGYNDNDQPITASLPGNVQANLGCDGSGRLTSLGYTGSLTDTYSSSYDAGDRTSAVTSTVGGVSTTQNYTHDAAGRLTGYGPTSIGYDGNGNIAAVTTGVTTTNYTYNPMKPNEVTSLTGPSGTTSYGYDHHGDTTAVTGTAGTTTLSYGAQQRLVGVTLANGTAITMTYNANGERARYQANTGVITTSVDERFSYRDGVLAQAAVMSGTTSYTDTYLYDPEGNPLELLRQQNGTTNRYWYETDRQGSVVALTDSNGNVVDRYSYDAWGVPTGTMESVPQELRYAGYWYDRELGWYWVSVRQYDPGLKRWLQPDPSGVTTWEGG